MGLVQVGGVVLGLEVVGEGHAFAFGLCLAQGFELRAALGDQWVFILGGSGGGGWLRQGDGL